MEVTGWPEGRVRADGGMDSRHFGYSEWEDDKRAEYIY